MCDKVKAIHPLDGEPIYCPKNTEFVVTPDEGEPVSSCRSHVGHFVIQFRKCTVERKGKR